MFAILIVKSLDFQWEVRKSVIIDAIIIKKIIVVW